MCLTTHNGHRVALLQGDIVSMLQGDIVSMLRYACAGSAKSSKTYFVVTK